jgi:hypothetical protein
MEKYPAPKSVPFTADDITDAIDFFSQGGGKINFLQKC